MKKSILLTIAICSNSLFSFAQVDSSSVKNKFSFGASYGISKPIGDFGDNHFNFVTSDNLSSLQNGSIEDINFASILENGFAKEDNQFNLFVEYDHNEHFGAFAKWSNSAYGLHQDIVNVIAELGNQLIANELPISASLGVRVSDWKSNSIVLGPTARQDYNKFSVQAKAGIGILFLESPSITLGIDQILGIPFPLDLMKVPEEKTTSFIYSLGLSAQYEVLNKTHIRLGMEYAKSKVKMENMSVQAVSQDLDIELPTGLFESVDFDVDYQTINFSLGLIRNL